jgi:phosphohistidine phosphatase
MPTLSLLRHAKSNWDDPRLPDFERRLAARGRRAAPLMGQHMHAIGSTPDLVLCSPAVRTRETAALVVSELIDPDIPIIYEAAIYEAEARTLLDLLRIIEDDAHHVVLIGHNPGLQNLVELLIGGKWPVIYEELALKLPTAALVVMDLPVQRWADLTPGAARITHAMTPRCLERRS